MTSIGSFGYARPHFAAFSKFQDQKYWDNTRFRQKKLHAYDFQVRLWVAAFLAFLVLKFWKCGKIWPSISKWTYKCQKNLEIQVRKYSAFDLAFLTFVGLFKILPRSLRCKKSGSMQEQCKLAFYHQKQILLKISHFEPVWLSEFKLQKNHSKERNHKENHTKVLE